MRNAEAVSGGRVSVPRAGMDTSGVLRALTPLRALSLSHLCTSQRGVLWGGKGLSRWRAPSGRLGGRAAAVMPKALIRRPREAARG